MVALAALVAAVGSALVPVNDAARAAVVITGIHISELNDPTPYLEGGEALLTTGIPILGSDAQTRDYVTRLRDRGISALVLGLGPTLDEVPASLEMHCRDLKLPLLVVPVDQPFVRVTRGYWELVAASGRATLMAQLGTQASVVREAAKPDGISRVVSRVAQAVGGWAAYIPLNGDEPLVWPETQRGVIPGLQVEVRRFEQRGGVGAATFPLHGHDVVAHSVGSGAQARAVFTVGLGRRPTNADKQLILTATAALGLREQARGDALAARRSVGEAVVNLLLAGEVRAAQALVESTGGRALSLTMRVFAFPPADERRGQPSAPPRLDGMINELVRRGLLSAAAAERSRPARASSVSGVGVLLLSGPLGTDEAAVVEPGAELSELTGALGEVVRLPELGASVAAAVRRAREAARGEVVTTRPVTGFDEGEIAAERLAKYTRTPLVDTTRSYLRHRGSWEEAARELGVHRNTVRNRIRIVTDELGIDLDDADLSAELWIALRGRS